MKVIRQLLSYLMILVSSAIYSQPDTCNAIFCYSAVSDSAEGYIVTFQNNSTSYNPIVDTYWDFGDGSTSTVLNPTHGYYMVVDGYIVTLQIITSTGCMDSYTDTLAIGNTCDTNNHVVSLPGKENIILFPTIVSNTFKIVNNEYNVPVRFSLIDEFGKTVLELFLFEYETEICKQNIPNGIYFYKIDTHEKLIKRGKIIFD